MELIKVTMANLPFARALQNAIFPPDEDAWANYLEAVKGISGNEYWILTEDGGPVGVSGIYVIDAEPKCAWLGWFGILPEHRRKGLGSKAIALFEEQARKRGFTTVRLYTARDDNDAAKTFYRRNGYSEEEYGCPYDAGALHEPLSIFSKNLDGSAPVPWGDKFLGIDEQLEKQRKAFTMSNK